MDKHTAVSRPIASLSPVELIAMGARIDPVAEAQRLERILSPASREQRLSAVLDMMGQFGVSAPKGEEEARLFYEGYLLALEGYPIWCILETCRAFVRGTVEVSNREFLPKPASVGAELARRVDDFRSRLVRARKQADENRQLDTGWSGPRSPELREAGDRRVSDLRAISREEDERLRPKARARTDEYRPSRPLTEEDLKDVPLAPKRAGAFRHAGAALPKEMAP